MLRETKELRKAGEELGVRPTPSLARTVQALRAIRGRRTRGRPEARILALRSGRQPA
jgi:hypothetical protein